MRLGLWAVVGLLFGAVAAHFLLQDNGYVLVSFRGYVVEMSVPALIIVLAAGYIAIRLLVRLWRSPRALGRALAERRSGRAEKRLTRGLMHMAEGDWSKGERLLTQGLRAADGALVNYLMAARAAQRQGSQSRRDEWLKLAYEEIPKAELAVLLTQAELQLEDGAYERAVATLSRIREAHPNHPMALALLARAYRALAQWQELVKLLPRLDGARLEPGELERLAHDALEPALGASDLTRERLDELWSSLPPRVRRAPALVRLQAMALNRLGQGEEAEKSLRAALKREWAAELVRAYGDVKASDPARQLRQAESWLKSHSEDGVLLLTAAKLCMANQLWGKARSYLESSLALSPEAESYALYGRLLSQLGEEDEAAAAYRSGLSLLTPAATLPALAGPAETGRPSPRRSTGSG